MRPPEIIWRLRVIILQHYWKRREGTQWPTPSITGPITGRAVGAPIATITEGPAGEALVKAADAVVAGSWSVFGTLLHIDDIVPTWHRDPQTGRHSPFVYFSKIRFRDETSVGNVKYIWEISRLHHITLLASAYHTTQDIKYGTCALRHLQSWWADNPPLQGVNWTSGIELGIRLLAWVWCRRLLAAHPDVENVFERNEVFLCQLHAHQAWIASFHSRGSSANNHLIAEMAGLLAASLAFPCFPESGTWWQLARQLLEQEAVRQNFPDGINRELASDYQVLVLGLLLCAGAEADAAARPLSSNYWQHVRSMADALAALVDSKGCPPRQGDGDEGLAILLDSPELSTAGTLLAACARIFGSPVWWPRLPTFSVTASLLAGLSHERRNLAGERPRVRPSTFAPAGISILRDRIGSPDEIWCRMDHGPHGFLSIAAHAHADALSIEVREAGCEILVDPGTYCYHGEPEWRNYFRSTLGHNTLEIGGLEQSVPGGSFLWVTQADGRLLRCGGLDGGDEAFVVACHDGYQRLPGKPVHYRKVRLDRIQRRLTIQDWIRTSSPQRVRLGYHLHPDVHCELAGNLAMLTWRSDSGMRAATFQLPEALIWTAHRAGNDPIVGWYSPGFGRKEPTITLVGTGEISDRHVLESELAFSKRAADEHKGGECDGVAAPDRYRCDSGPLQAASPYHCTKSTGTF
jgi:Heparinase II/III-like protein/Heparinase II/III N-terminus